MTIDLLSMILFLIFTALGGFHFYWFFGGTWGLSKVIPTKTTESNSLSIPKFATLVVALGLTLFGLLYLNKSVVLALQLPNWINNYVYWIIPSIFILRAIGDFNYVGLFKRIKDTAFAKADSKLFTPLCIGIGILGILINLW